MDPACPTYSRTMTIRIPQIIRSAPHGKTFHVELKCARKKNKQTQTLSAFRPHWHVTGIKNNCTICASGLEHVDSLALLFCFPEVIGYGVGVGVGGTLIHFTMSQSACRPWLFVRSVWARVDVYVYVRSVLCIAPCDAAGNAQISGLNSSQSILIKLRSQGFWTGLTEYVT